MTMRLSGPARKLLLNSSRCVLNSNRQQSSQGRRQSTQAQVSQKSSLVENAKIAAINPSTDNHSLEVEWKDGTKGNFPYVWLRDCAVTEKPADPTELHADLEPHRQVLNEAGDKVDIIWPPYLRAEYHSEWLKDRVPGETRPNSALLEGAYAKLLTKNGGIQLWSKENHPDICGLCPTYHQILDDPNVAQRALVDFLKFGVLRIEDADNAKAEQLMQSLGIAGKRLEYTVRKRQAHEAVRLQTSCCELDCTPEIIMIKYNEPGQGIDQISDAFAVVNNLRKVHPVAFSSLANHELLYTSRMNKPLQSRHPVIELDKCGEVVKVVYNNEMRQPEEQTSPGDHALEVYDAIKHMMITAYKKVNRVDIVPKKNHMILINNHRIMHGRTGYASSSFDRAEYAFWQCAQ